LVEILLIDVLITYQTYKIAEKNSELSKMEIIKVQNQLQLEHYEDTILRYNESRKIIHDLRKHIDVYADLKKEDIAAAEKYSNLINKNINSLVGEFVCSNRILSIIMEHKINQAKRENIEVHLKFTDIPFDFMSDLDVTALFANLWDNAIEGAKTVTDGYRSINITVGEDDGLTVIIFENNYNGILIKQGENFITTKSGEHQGLGLSIINKTVTVNGGHISVSNTDKIFKVSVMFTPQRLPPPPPP
jgi:sensor histidine kinase regulating citrate/malate metabolism